MTTLATDSPRAYELGELNDLPVIAADIIYEGAAVGDNGSGYARPLTAGDPFRGFALAKADNASGGAGDVNVHIRTRGKIQLSVTSVAITDVGKPVYASDDNTFVLTASTNSHVGRVARFISSGVAIVEFDASRAGIGLVTPLTDSTGGTANDTLAAVPNPTDTPATADALRDDIVTNLLPVINGNFADIAAKIAALAGQTK